jgi:hypothetical protein
MRSSNVGLGPTLLTLAARGILGQVLSNLEVSPGRAPYGFTSRGTGHLRYLC